MSHNYGLGVRTLYSLDNALAKLAGSGKSVCRNRDIIADYFGRRGFNLVYIHTERTYDGRLHLMRVNYEINLGAKTICLGMNALFGGRLNVTLIAAIVDINNYYFVGSKSLIGTSARSNNEFLIVYSARNITPRSRDKAVFHNLYTGFNDELFCFHYIHCIHLFVIYNTAGQTENPSAPFSWD